MRRRTSQLETSLSLIEQTVYDAIVEPRLWPRVLSNAQTVIGATAASLVVRRKRDLAVVDPIAATWEEQAAQDYFEYYQTQDIVAERLAHVSPGSPFILQELIDMQPFQKTSFFRDWASKNGVAFFAAITFEIDRQHIGALSFHRPDDRVAFSKHEKEFIRRVATPLRFALGQRRLTMERDVARGSLERLVLGIVHLDEQGRIAWCNPYAEQLLREADGLTSRNGRLCALDEETAGLLAELIDDALGGDVSPRGVDLLIPRPGGKSPLHLVAVPLSRKYSISLMGNYVPTAIFINTQEDEPGYEAALLHMWELTFNLTAKQARIANGLVAGLTYKELATATQTVETVRSHIKAVYAKTNVTSRAELQTLARNLVMPLRRAILGRRKGA